MVAHIRLRVGKVNFGVRHVQVAAKNHGFARLELFEKTQEGAVPLLAIGQAAEIAPGIGHIHIDEEEARKLGGENAAFRVMLRDLDARWRRSAVESA